MNIDCNRCGTRFDVSTTERRAFCPHCGETAVLPRIWTPSQSPATPQGKASKKKAPSPKSVPKSGPSSSRDPQRGRPRSKGPLIFGLVVLAVLGGAVGLFFFGLKKVESRASSSGWFGRVCLTDVNGDTVLDVAGFFGTPTRGTLPLSFFDGMTGEKFWTGGAYEFEKVKLLCLGPSSVGVELPDNRVDVVRSKAPGPVARVAVTGPIDNYGTANDCVELVSGGVITAATLDGQALAACQTERRSPALPAGYTNNPSDNIWWVSRQGTTYTLIPDVGITHYLIAASFPGALPRDPYGAPMAGQAFHAALSTITTNWKMKLPYTAVFAAGIPAVLIDQTLVTWGGDPKRKDVAGVLIGLNVKDGSVLYAKVQGEAWSTRLRELHYNGKYVVAAWGEGIYGYEPATGKRIWSIGG